MATWYVDSTATGSNAGTSWTNACTSFAQLFALGSPPAAGDDIDVYWGHNETTAAAVTHIFPGTIASPNRVFSCDKTNAPATGTDLVAGFNCTGSITTNVLTLSALAVIGTSTTALPAVGNSVNGVGVAVGCVITSVTTPWNGTTGVYGVSTTSNVGSEAIGIGAAAITVTGANAYTLYGTVYVYGLTINAGTTAGNSGIFLENNTGGYLKMQSCILKVLDLTNSNDIAIGNSNSGDSCRVDFIDTGVYFAGGTGSGINPSNCDFRWRDTNPTNNPNSGVCQSGTVPTDLFVAAFTPGVLVEVQSVDLSNFGSGKTIVAAWNEPSTAFLFKNCKVNASATLAATPTVVGATVDFINCDSGATTYKQQRFTYWGTLTPDTVVVNNASDDVTPISWKVATSAHAKVIEPFECFEIIQWVDTTGTSHTATIGCITDLTTDATALTNADIWVEAQVMDNSGSPLGDLYTSAPANVLTAGSTLAAGSGWTTTGLTTPDQRQMAVTFTNQIKGYVRFVVKVARASLTTLRVNPNVAIV